MRVLLVLAVGVLLAGCAAPPVQTASTEPLPTLTPSATLAKVVDPAGGEGEPSLAVLPDGTLFTNGAGASGALYVSRDNGSTWQKLPSPTAPMPNYDPDLAASADGVLWYDNLWLGCTAVASSQDAGKTWTMSPAGCTPPAGDRQYAIPVKGGEAYLYSHHLPTLKQMVVHTTDYGRTWVPVGMAEGPGVPDSDGRSSLLGLSGWGGGGFYDAAKGSVWVTFTHNDLTGNEWSVGAGVLRQGATFFELVRVPSMGGDSVGLGLVVGAADKAGNAYLAWAEANGKDMAVYVVSSADDGKTWSHPTRVDNGTGSKVFPAITAGPAGKVAVAYYEANENEYPARVSKDAKWNVTLAWTDDARADNVTWQRMQLSSSSARTGPICPDGTSCQGNRQLLDYFALKTLPDGRVASVWTSTDDVKDKTVNVFASTVDPILS